MSTYTQLLAISHQSLLDLGTDLGINASGKEEIFGCFFGRDSAITVLMTLKALENDPEGVNIDREKLIAMCRRTLLTIADLAGTEFNDQSGEAPGKFIHEYRVDKFEHLTNWYLYPGPVMKNYDSIDATPLGLVAMCKYFLMTHDGDFLRQVLPAVKKGLHWMMEYGDIDGDGLLEYEFSPERNGGLHVQSWTDSEDSLRQADGSFPDYPIAPVEVQGYVFWALKLWSDFFGEQWPELSLFASYLKYSFQEKFVYQEGEYQFLAQALDGNKKQIKTVTGNPLLLLWSTYEGLWGKEAVIDASLITDLVHRSFKADLFDDTAGIRTMSISSPTFNSGQDSYHNGSFWPKLNGLAYEGLINWGYLEEARRLRQASLLPLAHFATPIELYTKGADGGYLEYKNASGQVSCRNQAWSAAVMLDLLSVKE